MHNQRIKFIISNGVQLHFPRVSDIMNSYCPENEGEFIRAEE